MGLTSLHANISALVFLLLFSMEGCRAFEKPLSKDAQVEQAVITLWKHGGNHRALCTSFDRRTADQAGYQEMAQQFLPGQWVVRYALAEQNQKANSQREFEIRQLDYLAGVGLLEKRETELNIGMISGARANEYRATLKGWIGDIFSGDKENAPCFYYGMAELLRVVDSTESEKDADGYRTLKVNYLHGVVEFTEWAKGDEAASLFRSIKQSRDGQPGSWTLYRSPEGKLEVTRGSRQYLEDIAQRSASVAYEKPDENAVIQAIEYTRNSPGPSPSQKLPEPCLLLTYQYGRELWQLGDKAAAAEVIFDVSAATGSALEVLIASYARIAQLSKAGLLALNEVPRQPGESSSARKFLIRPHPAIRDLLSQHGACLPLGDTRIELVGVVPDENHPNRVRFKARFVVTRPSDWTSLIPSKESLPDLSAILRDGLPFEGTVYKSQSGWQAAYISASPPRYRLPRLSSAGIATAWVSAADRAEAMLSSASDHDVHIINGRLPPEGARSPESSDASRNTINIYVNPATRPTILLLYAYDATQWNFTLAPEARVGSILAVGYHEQTVSGILPKTKVVTVKRDFVSTEGSLTQLGTLEVSRLLQLLGTNPASVIETNGAKPVIINRQ